MQSQQNMTKMNKQKLIKHHQWFGLVVGFFLLMFCVSGILLNHRSLILNANVSRSLLPSRYEYRDWNGGLLRGTVPIDSAFAAKCVPTDSKRLPSVLIYGASGLFVADSAATEVADFNDGLPSGADYRLIRNALFVGSTQVKTLFAVSPFALYRYGAHGTWHKQPIVLADDNERLTDIAAHSDTLVVLSRSHVYIATAPYTTFRCIALSAPARYKERTTVFRTIWLLHSGELFGTVGKLFVDAIAVVIVVLILTGFVFFVMKKTRRRWRNKGLQMKHTLLWHDHVGRKTIVATVLLCATGWCLRPPVMVLLALTKTPTIPFTTQSSDNPWHDRLRMIRYDNTANDWLLSASDGIYALGAAIDAPRPTLIESAPPTNVMGMNVWQQRTDGSWLCGSFSGMHVWNREKAIAVDYFTGKPSPKKMGAPFGARAVAGYSADFRVPSTKKSATDIVTDYYEGTTAIAQPERLGRLPMSLWNVALEVHSARIYMPNTATYVFVFLIGIAAVWCLWTGWRTRLGGGRKH